MAAESGEVSSMMEQLRSSFIPILLGLMGPDRDSSPDRLVLVNPATQGMIVLRGDSDTINEILASGGGGGRSGTPPASKASIDALKAVEAEECGDEEECSVCLDGLKGKKTEEEEKVKEMPCKHRYHGGCIEKWLKMHGSCPVCRFMMPVEESDGSRKEEEGDEGERRRRRRRGRAREIWVTIAVPSRREGEAEGEDQQERSDERAED